MDDSQYIRKVQTSVTNFLYCGDDFLFLHRSPHKKIDANRLNGIGGRVEPGENFVEAAVRETKEETGYVVSPANMQLVSVVRLEGGYQEDWVMCFFKTPVPSKEISKGVETEDGKLVWIHKEKVLDSNYQLVDDLNYCFKDIVAGNSIIFMTAQVSREEKIVDVRISKLASRTGPTV